MGWHPGAVLAPRFRAPDRGSMGQGLACLDRKPAPGHSAARLATPGEGAPWAPAKSPPDCWPALNVCRLTVRCGVSHPNGPNPSIRHTRLLRRHNRPRPTRSAMRQKRSCWHRVPRAAPSVHRPAAATAESISGGTPPRFSRASLRTRLALRQPAHLLLPSLRRPCCFR